MSRESAASRGCATAGRAKVEHKPTLSFFLNDRAVKTPDGYYLSTPNELDVLVAILRRGVNVVLCVPTAEGERPPTGWAVPDGIAVMELPYYSDNVDLIRRSPILLLNSMKSYWPEMGGWDCAGGAVPSLLGLLLVSVALLRRKTPFMYMRGNVRLSLKYENATKSPWRRLVVAGTFWPLERYTRILSKCGIRTFTMGKELARLQCGSRVYALPGYGRPAIIEPLGYLPLAPDSLHRIVSVGRLSHEKGVDVLIKARAALAADDRDVELVIAGDGAERPALERLACDLGIHDSVRFLGHISDAQDLRSIYLGGGIFVLPSRTEGVPLAMLEAMALGRAVIATAVGGVPTVLEHERNGLLVPPDDDRSLASSIARLMDDIQFAQRLGREAHETGSSYTADAQGAFILQELLPACRNPSAPVAIDKS